MKVKIVQKIFDPPGSSMYQVIGSPDFIGDRGFSKQHITVTKPRYNVYCEDESGEVQHFLVTEDIYNSVNVGELIETEVLSIT